MGLIQPSGPSWAYCTHNLPSDVDATDLGATCTPGTSNSDGTAVALFSSALAHDVEYLRLGLNVTAGLSANNDILLTVLIDPAGGTNWSTLIPDLVSGPLGGVLLSGSSPAGWAGAYDFPLWIPAGASLGVRARTAHTTAQTIKVAAFALGGNRNPASWWCGQRVTAVGSNPSISAGTSHTPGASGAFSSWADLGSPLTFGCGALQWGVAGEGDSSYLQASYQFEFGVGAERIGPPLFRHLTSLEAGFWLPTGPVFRTLPAGAQLQVRGTCDGGSPQSLSVAAYAVH